MNMYIWDMYIYICVYARLCLCVWTFANHTNPRCLTQRERSQQRAQRACKLSIYLFESPSLSFSFTVHSIGKVTILLTFFLSHPLQMREVYILLDCSTKMDDPDLK